MTLSEVEILMQDLNRHVSDETQILFGTAVDGRMGNRLAVTLISSLSADGPVAEKLIEREPIPAAVPAPPLPVREPARPEPEPTVTTAPHATSTFEESEEEPAQLSPAPPPPPPAAPRPLQMIEAVLPSAELLLDPEETLEPEIGAEPMAELAPSPPPPPPVPVAEQLREPEPEPARPEPPRVILPKKKPALMREPKPAVEKIVQAKQEVLQFESVTRGRFEKSEPTIVEGQDLDVPTFLRKNVRVK
jgi:cell division protein FtsZ